ncbi:MAG: antitoxin VapB family protein [Candidatus Thorarchaeota archaeon]|nr:antitoxin VapB family protein [Candidatus Thorarchaeota archaeon]
MGFSLGYGSAEMKGIQLVLSLYVYILICMLIVMAKNIALAEDVYRDLKRMKRREESFSDLIRRLMRTRGMISDLAGTETLSTEEWLEMKKLKAEQDAADGKRTESLLSRQEG